MTTATEVLELTKALIRIDSSNPTLVDTGAGERAIAAYVRQWLEAHDFACRLVGPEERPSVIAVHSGTGGRRSIMLNGHLDTVSLESFDGPALEPRVEGRRLHGRGAYDMKGGVAALMVAAADAATIPHRGDIILTLVADEEDASAGTAEVLKHVTADGAIITEPTDEDMLLAHRGFVWAEVTVHGVAAHGSRRDLGTDAIVGAGAFLVTLGEHDATLAAAPEHELLGTGSVHASLIRGGEELSSYPAECVISLERRTLPGENASTVYEELLTLVHPLQDDTGCTFDVRILFERNPFTIDPTDPVVTTVTNAIKTRRGKAARTRGGLFWTDCALLSDAGIPAVLYGIAGDGAHAADEWINIDSLAEVTATVRDAITTFIE